jgi:hypothetical protein
VIGWVAGNAWQAWAAENRVISACLNGSGQVLSLQLGTPPASRQCARVLSWNQSGPPGSRGSAGPPGAPGTQWFVQTDEPATAAEGDFWIDSDDGQIWRYSQGSGWISTGFFLSKEGGGNGRNGDISGGGGGGFGQ